MKSCIRHLVLLLSFMLMLSGCARLEMNYIIEDDGAVHASYIIAAEKSAEEQVDIADIMNAAREEAAANGFSVTDYDRDGYSGIMASKAIERIDLRNAGNEMLGFSILPAIIKDFSWHYEPNVFHSQYHLRMTVDLDEIIDEAALGNLPLDLKEDALKAIEASQVSINITLPGKPDRTNADQTNTVASKNATRYTWNLKIGQQKSLLIDATLEKDKVHNPVVWLTAALAAAVILTGALFIRKIKRRTKK